MTVTSRLIESPDHPELVGRLFRRGHGPNGYQHQLLGDDFAPTHTWVDLRLTDGDRFERVRTPAQCTQTAEHGPHPWEDHAYASGTRGPDPYTCPGKLAWQEQP